MATSALVERIQSLTPERRRLLAMWSDDQTLTSTSRLVAYVAAIDTSLDFHLLREICAEVLPEHMVPSSFQMVESLPRLRSGKIDRVSLAEAEVVLQPVSQERVLPESATERSLARIWGDVLEIDSIGVDENYFELGGDSLLSIRILSRAVQAGFRVAAEQFLAYPTIREQARFVDSVTGTRQLEPVQEEAERFALSGLDEAGLADVASQIRNLDQLGK